MCGIAGIFGKSDIETLKRMLSVLNHRGPDDEYYVSGADYCLGVRRLSIIDVQGGRQPLSNENEMVWVAQNGEIYNFKSIRDSLSSKGHIFRTCTDTEAIVHAYEEYGDKFYDVLQGMFAVAVWDENKKIGYLVRDRVGKKPLYYTYINNNLYFASEIKALLQIPDFEKKINFEALHYYLSYKHIPSPLSIYEGINILLPATILTYALNKELYTRKYWQANYSTNKYIEGLDEKQLSDELLRVLTLSVKKRLVGDVPIGFFLSGGIDSGLVTAIASVVADKKIDTFTLTYNNESTGKKTDRQCAKKIAKLYDTNHHEELINYPNFTEEFPKIISCFDEPFAGVTSTYFLSKYISKYVKVAITGDGADELFGSYLSHRLASTMNIDKNDWQWRYSLMVFSDIEKLKLYSRDVFINMEPYDTLAHLKRYFNDMTAKDSLNGILEMEFKSIFPDQVLTFADRLSMAHSLELRSPYLDTNFVEMVLMVGGDLKIKNGETKYILKKMASHYLPTEIVNRPKEGFIMPVTEWLYKDLRGYVNEVLSINSLNKHGMFMIDYVQTLIKDFYNSEYDYIKGNKILSLLAFQVWYDIYMNGVGV